MEAEIDNEMRSALTGLTEHVERRIRELEAETGEPLPQVRADEFALTQCQGNLLRGYNMAFVRHLVVRVGDQAAACRFLADVVDPSSRGPHLTTGANWNLLAPMKMPIDPDSCVIFEEHEYQQMVDDRRHASETCAPDGKPATCLNVGITAKGLVALGLDDASYRTFPEEFREGAARRASKVGDVDGSAPEHWIDGFHDENLVHLMWTLHSTSESRLDEACDELLERWNTSGAFIVTSCLDGAKLPDKVTGKPGHDVHFGYRDDIAQPRFELDVLNEWGWDTRSCGDADNQPPVPVGALLQGTGATSFSEVRWQLPALVDARGEQNYDLSRFGCYNAFRKMEQDVVAFENFLTEQAEKLGWNKEYLAAKLMGRWRNGVPMVETRDHQRWSDPDLEEMPGVGLLLNNFDYAADFVAEQSAPDRRVADNGDEISAMVVEQREGINDPDGTACPLGSHIRRSNPRRGLITQRSANHTRQIVRRGMPYGPRFDPDDPADPDNPDDAAAVKRGLLGSFFCGSLLSQFESMMYDWINIGLQDPRITGTNCPIVGANRAESSRLDISYHPDPYDPDDPDRVETVTIRGFPRFVETVGAAYFFYPGVPGLRLLGTLHERAR